MIRDAGDTVYVVEFYESLNEIEDKLTAYRIFKTKEAAEAYKKVVMDLPYLSRPDACEVVECEVE